MTTTTEAGARTAGRTIERIDALLLAGGRSRRFGRDKRQALLGGRTLAAIAIDKLRAVVDGDLLVAGAGTFQPRGAGIVVDDLARDRGPLAAIAGGLLRCRFGVLVLPCDVPLVAVDTLAALLRVARQCGRIVALRTARGWEPLIAFYPRSTFPLLAAALREGCSAPHRLLDRSGAVALQVGPVRELSNINRPADLAALQDVADVAQVAMDPTMGRA